MSPMTAFNLPEYLNRIGYAERPRLDLATFRALHQAHVRAIPFENLEIQMGGSIALDPEALQAKLVRRRRGGYCFEQNGLFALLLRSVGFELDACEARVRQSVTAIRPRTHMVLKVRSDERQWLADVGFGGDGLIAPIALDGSTAEQAGTVYRVAPEGSLQVLQRHLSGGWEDLYAISPDPVHPIDFEVGNWYTSTHPGSAFVLNLTAQRVIDDRRHMLRNLTYTVARGAEVSTREIDRAELVPLLRGTFGLDVPDDARFRALDP